MQRKNKQRNQNQNRGEKGKEKELTRELKIGLIEFEDTENEIAKNANLRMQNNETYRI